MAATPIAVQLSTQHAQQLAKLGARAHRGGGVFSRTQVLGRMLDALHLYQSFTDPRQTRNLPEAYHALIIRLLPKPWELRRFEIQNLEGVLAATPGFDQAVATAQIDPATLLAAIGGASPAEKLTLVTHAILHQAPAAAGGDLASGLTSSSSRESKGMTIVKVNEFQQATLP
jgi:hypothetical protein